ncbi:hypothetical protein BLNAU_19531 [Blattamonas nauphoetae]|uniref:Uncharacterized protein n=1 Tax=Blattamonas nauphoetae TaxID=2049346 RepID=A0ABQ9X175_9EUKA|nr:hypothetical protein BLNAU_19531 [Blattamonas nauphoetae]
MDVDGKLDATIFAADGSDWQDREKRGEAGVVLKWVILPHCLSRDTPSKQIGERMLSGKWFVGFDEER